MPRGAPGELYLGGENLKLADISVVRTSLQNVSSAIPLALKPSHDCTVQVTYAATEAMETSNIEVVWITR